jgi:ubiquinone/menaquinone biosynthesis C-methylase UbiE
MPHRSIDTMEVIADEIEFLRTLVRLEGARAVDLGCGNGDFARKLLTQGGVASVDAFEVDEVQHASNLKAPAVPGLTFGSGGAERIPVDDASCDLIVMMKSLHHVPGDLMDDAFAEIRRVLKPGGHLYVSEPVYDGPFNDIVKLFHDEGTVRAAAYAALKRADGSKVLALVSEHEFMAPLFFRDFADFERRIIQATHSEHVLTAALKKEVRDKLEAHMTPEGARFVRPMRIDLMRRAS